MYAQPRGIKLKRAQDSKESINGNVLHAALKDTVLNMTCLPRPDLCTLCQEFVA
jgi:hypothetical protein